MKKAWILFLLIFVASCTTTPKLNLLKSSGLSMELDTPASYVFPTIFSPNGKYALSGSYDNVVAIWDLDAGKQIKTLKAQVGNTPGVTALSLSRDGRYLLTGTLGGGIVKLWDAKTWQEIRSLPGHSFTENMNEFVFSPDGKYAISGGAYHIKHWDVETGKELRNFTHASVGNQPRAIAFSPDRRFAFAKGLGYISLLDINTGERLWIYRANTGSRMGRSGTELAKTGSVKYSPGGEYLLSGEDTALKLRDAVSGQALRTFIDEGTGEILSVAFSPDGKYALSGSVDGNIRLWDIQTGVKLKKFIGHSDMITSVSFSPDGRHILSGGDASVRLWDISTGEEIATMIKFDENEWLIITPEGYYNASENGAQYLSVIVGENKYGVDKFYDVFYRPDIVAAKLRGENIQDLITIKMSDAIKSPPPVVEVASTKEIDQSKVKICYRVKSTGGGIGEVRLFHNGKLIKSDGYYREIAGSSSDKTQLVAMNSKAIYEDMRSISVKSTGNTVSMAGKSKGDVFEDCQEIDAIPGENEISVSAFNKSNTVQSYIKTINFNSKAKVEEPHLYILAVGIDQYNDSNVNLKYAVKDAKDIEEKLKKQSATLYKPQNIHYELLINDKADKGNISNKINEFSRIIKPNDGFILFVAGHGVLLQNQYYMLTHDYNGIVNDNSMISSNEIVEMSKKIKSLSQLFIFDTCHAGGVDTIISGLYDARMSVLAKKMGLHIYASASDKQSAMDGYKGNGLFTYALLDGLNNNKAADKNKDGKVSIVGLGEYSKKMTTDISKEIGHSQTPLIINFGKDSPIYKLQ